MPYTADLERLAAHYHGMPPVALMQLRIAGYDGRRLRLHAPLDVHVNDKGCAFGGSLASLMTLASCAEPAPETDVDEFLATLRIRGRARLALVAQTRLPDGGIATDFSARYVAIRKDE